MSALPSTGTASAVSVLIVNYHGHALTRRAALSVLQTAPGAEVIVVDNSDDAAEAQALQAALPPTVRLVVAPGNLGFGQGCNLAFEHAHGDFLLLLNPDAFVLPGCITTLQNTLAADPRIGAVAPLTWWDDSSGYTLPPAQMQSPRGEFLQALGLRWPPLGRWLSLRFRHRNLQDRGATAPIKQDMLSGGCMMVSRRAVERVGGLFDPSFFMYYEDTDLSLRLTRAALRLLLEPRAQAVHEWRNDPAKGQYHAASRERFMQRNYPGHARWDRLRLAVEQRMPVRMTLDGLHELGPRSVGADLHLPDVPGPWVLEVSAHPLLVPAVLKTGNGPVVLPAQAMARAHAGRCYARLSGADGRMQHYAWDIVG